MSRPVEPQNIPLPVETCMTDPLPLPLSNFLVHRLISRLYVQLIVFVDPGASCSAGRGVPNTAKQNSATRATGGWVFGRDDSPPSSV